MATLTSKNYWAFYLVVIAAISVAVDSTLSLSFLTFATLVCSGESAPTPRPTEPTPSPTESDLIITCDEVYDPECVFWTLMCPTDADCEVHCIAAYACEGANIVWSTNGVNTLICDGVWACAGVNFPIPPTDGNLEIVCDSAGECYWSTIYCPTDAKCKVNCDASDACYGANIVWSTKGVNTLICDGESACAGVNFPIPPVDENLEIFCDSEAECEDATIYCPTDADCEVNCIAIDACKDATIVWSTNGENTLNCDPDHEAACDGVTDLPDP